MNSPGSTSSGSASTSSSSSGAAAGECLQPALDSGYCLIWQDEFAGTALDTSKWNAEVNCWGGGNDEAQCYVDRPENLWVDGDFLHLKAIREDTTGPSVVDDDPNYSRDDTSGTGTYSSARIRSKNLGDWRYGRFEIRAKLPSGQGTWPAVWMLPTDNVYGGWASSGEIDIMEYVGFDPDRIHANIHTQAFNHSIGTGRGASRRVDEPDETFHVYAVEWHPDRIDFFVDGERYFSFENSGEGPAEWPFDTPHFLILNAAVGGGWGGQQGVDDSIFPQRYYIDYVRVYEEVP